MKIASQKRKRISFKKMSVLIHGGAKIVEFQNFLGRKSQSFRTIVIVGGQKFVSYHHSPFPFLIQEGGKLIDDETISKIPIGYAHCPS